MLHYKGIHKKVVHKFRHAHCIVFKIYTKEIWHNDNIFMHRLTVKQKLGNKFTKSFIFYSLHFLETFYCNFANGYKLRLGHFISHGKKCKLCHDNELAIQSYIYIKDQVCVWMKFLDGFIFCNCCVFAFIGILCTCLSISRIRFSLQVHI